MEKTTTKEAEKEEIDFNSIKEAFDKVECEWLKTKTKRKLTVDMEDLPRDKFKSIFGDRKKE